LGCDAESGRGVRGFMGEGGGVEGGEGGGELDAGE
jgi:hypothetical protein